MKSAVIDDDSNRTITNFTYNDLGRLIIKSITHPDGKQTEIKFTYNDLGVVVKKSITEHHADRFISETFFYYNEYGNLLSQSIYTGEGITQLYSQIGFLGSRTSRPTTTAMEHVSSAHAHLATYLRP